MDVEGAASEVVKKMPKDCKGNRYYYRHREEILARRKEKLMEDPEYRKKAEEREKRKEEREKERAAREALREEKRKLMGVTPGTINS